MRRTFASTVKTWLNASLVFMRLARLTSFVLELPTVGLRFEFLYRLIAMVVGILKIVDQALMPTLIELLREFCGRFVKSIRFFEPHFVGEVSDKKAGLRPGLFFVACSIYETIWRNLIYFITPYLCFQSPNADLNGSSKLSLHG